MSNSSKTRLPLRPLFNVSLSAHLSPTFGQKCQYHIYWDFCFCLFSFVMSRQYVLSMVSSYLTQFSNLITKIVRPSRRTLQTLLLRVHSQSTRHTSFQEQIALIQSQCSRLSKQVCLHISPTHKLSATSFPQLQPLFTIPL